MGAGRSRLLHPGTSRHLSGRREASPQMAAVRRRVLNATKAAGIRFLNACNENTVIDQLKEGVIICTGGIRRPPTRAAPSPSAPIPGDRWLRSIDGCGGRSDRTIADEEPGAIRSILPAWHGMAVLVVLPYAQADLLTRRRDGAAPASRFGAEAEGAKPGGARGHRPGRRPAKTGCRTMNGNDASR